MEEFRVDDAHEFLARAYDRLLLRPPDDVGRRFYLDAMATGRMTRLEVLQALATADEGAPYHITVNGLAEHHQRLYRTPLFGWLRRISGEHDRWLHLRPEKGGQ